MEACFESEDMEDESESLRTCVESHYHKDVDAVTLQVLSLIRLVKHTVQRQQMNLKKREM